MIAFETPCDLLSSSWQAIVCPVNCVGAMGSGLALAMANRDKQLESYYKLLCREGKMKIGTIHYYASSPYKRIVLFPTKDDWRNDSTVDYIEAGLKDFVDSYERNGITNVLFPMLGCGLGKLK